MKDLLKVVVLSCAIAACCYIQFCDKVSAAPQLNPDFQTSDPAKNPALTPAVEPWVFPAMDVANMMLTNTNIAVIKFGRGVINEPYVDRAEWRTETNRVDTAKTYPIVQPGEENLLVYRAATIHYTETVWSNLTAILVYQGKEFPVVVERRLAWTENKSRSDVPVLPSVKNATMECFITNTISGWVMTNQWRVEK